MDACFECAHLIGQFSSIILAMKEKLAHKESTCSTGESQRKTFAGEKQFGTINGTGLYKPQFLGRKQYSPTIYQKIGRCNKLQHAQCCSSDWQGTRNKLTIVPHRIG